MRAKRALARTAVNPRPFRELEAYAGFDFAAQSARLFLKFIPLRLQECRAAWDRKDLVKLDFAAHSLKAICGQVGAERMEESCAAIESCVEAGDLRKAGEWLRRIEEDSAAVTGWLDRFANGGPHARRH